MKVKVYRSNVSGCIKPPASKSFLHRAIISAALSKGKSRINNVVYSDDIYASLHAFTNLGVKVKMLDESLEIESQGLEHLNQEKVVDCNESGSTIRFLIPVLSNSYKTLFKGKSGLMKRPMTIYEDIFIQQNLKYYKNNEGIHTLGQLKPGEYIVPGDVSSQFISGLLFILPTLKSDSTIKIEGNFESSQYVDITVKVLSKFGINVDFSENIFYVPGNQKYVSTTINAEIDYSQAAFYAVLGTVNNNIQVEGLTLNSLQPDKKIIEIIQNMGGKIFFDKNHIHFNKSNTLGTTIDVSQCPDIAPILGLLAACSKGETNIVNAKRLIIKETNRLLATYETLKRLGVEVYIYEDSLKIIGTDILKGNTCDSYNDHRMAMTLGIAGTVCDSFITITNAQAVNKSYPRFFKDLESLGAIIKYIEE